jgi:mannose-6-phosphate isomerase-like protein (cupin superfamily)
MDREAVCSYLAATNIEHATLQFCERFDEKSRTWNFSKHAHPFFELIYFLEGRANVDAGDESVEVLGFDVLIYPPGLEHAEHLDLRQRHEIICLWADIGPTAPFDHAIKLMDEHGTLRSAFEMVYDEFTANRTFSSELISVYLQATLPPGPPALRRAVARGQHARRAVPRLHPRALCPGLRHRRAGETGLGEPELPLPAVQEEDAGHADALPEHRPHRQGEAAPRRPGADRRRRRRAASGTRTPSTSRACSVTSPASRRASTAGSAWLDPASRRHPRGRMISTVRYGYLPHLHKIRDRVALVAIASRTLAGARSVAEQYEIGTAVGSLDELLGLDLDAVVNLLPGPDHYASSVRVLESGRHLVTEKPITGTLEEADRLLDLAERQGCSWLPRRPTCSRTSGSRPGISSPRTPSARSHSPGSSPPTPAPPPWPGRSTRRSSTSAGWAPCWTWPCTGSRR